MIFTRKRCPFCKRKMKVKRVKNTWVAGCFNVPCIGWLSYHKTKKEAKQSLKRRKGGAQG